MPAGATRHTQWMHGSKKMPVERFVACLEDILPRLKQLAALLAGVHKLNVII